MLYIYLVFLISYIVLNFETVRCGAYLRAALVRGRRLFQS